MATLAELKAWMLTWLNQWGDAQESKFVYYQKEISKEVRVLETNLNGRFDSYSAMIKDINNLTRYTEKINGERTEDHDLLIKISQDVSHIKTQSAGFEPNRVKYDLQNLGDKIRGTQELVTNDHKHRLEKLEAAPGNAAMQRQEKIRFIIYGAIPPTVLLLAGMLLNYFLNR